MNGAGNREHDPEHSDTPAFRRWWVGGWLAPLLVTGWMLIWVFVIYWLIGDRPTDWNYGVTPYVPGESVFSTEHPPKGKAPAQVIIPPAPPARGEEGPSDSQ